MNGLYINKLGKIGKEYNKEIKELAKEKKIEHDCRLTYDRITKKFTILIPEYKTNETINNREKYAALDPGEKIFQAYYGEKSFGIIGEGLEEIILNYREKISRIRSILDKKLNRKGKKMSHKKPLQ